MHEMHNVHSAHIAELHRNTHIHEQCREHLRQFLHAIQRCTYDSQSNTCAACPRTWTVKSKVGYSAARGCSTQAPEPLAFIASLPQVSSLKPQADIHFSKALWAGEYHARTVLIDPPGKRCPASAMHSESSRIIPWDYHRPVACACQYEILAGDENERAACPNLLTFAHLPPSVPEMRYLARMTNSWAAM
jgi:hypothetical protein